MRDNPESSKGSWFYRRLKGVLGVLAVFSAAPATFRSGAPWGAAGFASEAGHDPLAYGLSNLTSSYNGASTFGGLSGLPSVEPVRFDYLAPHGAMLAAADTELAALKFSDPLEDTVSNPVIHYLRGRSAELLSVEVSDDKVTAAEWSVVDEAASAGAFISDDIHLRGAARKLATACPLSISFPSSPQYTESVFGAPTSYSFNVVITQTIGGCLIGSISSLTGTLDSSYGTLSPQTSSDSNQWTSWSFPMTFTPVDYLCRTVPISYLLIGSTGGVAGATMNVACQQVRVPLASIISSILSPVAVKVGNATVALGVSDFITNLNSYTLDVAVPATYSSWVKVVNPKTGLLLIATTSGQQGSYSIPFSVRNLNDLTNYLNYTLPLIVDNTIPAMSSVLIPKLSYGQTLSQILPLPPSASAFVADGDGVEDICPGGAPPCRVKLVNAAPWMSFDNRTGLLSGQPTTPPPAGGSSLYSGQLVLTDSAGAAASTTISVEFDSSLSFSNTGVTQIIQGQATNITGLSVSTPGVANVTISLDPSFGVLKVNPAIAGSTVVPSTGQSTSGMLTISGANTNAVLASLQIVPTVTNRSPVTIKFNVLDSLGQTLPEVSKLIIVDPVNHPLAASSVPLNSVTSTSTQAMQISVSSANLVNVDSVLWVLNSVQIFNSTGTLVASDVQLNGWTITGLNQTPTNQQASVFVSSPTGSQGTYTVVVGVQPVDSSSVPLPGMSALSLNNTASIGSAAIVVPPKALDNIGVGNSTSFILPAASTTGDSLIDQITNLPAGWSYDSSTRKVTALASTTGPVTLIRQVCAAHDPSQCVTQTYTTVAVSTLITRSIDTITQLTQDQLTIIPLLKVSTPGVPIVTVSVNSVPVQLQANSSVAGMSLTPLGAGEWQVNLTTKTTARTPVVVSMDVSDSLGQSIPTQLRTFSVIPVVHPAVAALPLTAVSTTPTQQTTLVVSNQNWANQDGDPSWKVSGLRLVKNGVTITNSTNPGSWIIGGAINQITSTQALLSITPPADSQASVDSVEVDVDFFNADGVYTQTLTLTTPYSVTTTPIVVPQAAFDSVDVGKTTTYIVPPYSAPGITCNDTFLNLPVGWSYNATSFELTVKPSSAAQVNLVRQVMAVHSGELAKQIYSITGVASLSMTSAIDNTLTQDALTTFILGTIKTPAGPPVVSVYVNSLLVPSVSISGPNVTLTQIDPETWQVNLNNYVTHSRTPLPVSVNVRDVAGQAVTQTGIFSVTPVVHPATTATPLSALSVISTQNGTFSVGPSNFDDPDGDAWAITGWRIVNTNTGLSVANSTDLNGWGVWIDSRPSNKLLQVSPPRDGQGSYFVEVNLQFSNAAGVPTKTLSLSNSISVPSAPITIPTATLSDIGVDQNDTVILPLPTTVGSTLTTRITNLPAAWTYDPATRALGRNPSTTGPVFFTLEACDAAGVCATQTYSTNVVPMMVVSNMNALTAFVGRGFSYSAPVPTSAVGYHFTISLENADGTPAPSWAQPDPSTGVCSAIIPANANPVYNFVPVYTAVESGKKYRTASFSFTAAKALQVQFADCSLDENKAGTCRIAFDYPAGDGNVSADILIPPQAAMFNVTGINTTGLSLVKGESNGYNLLTAAGPRATVAAFLGAISVTPVENYFGSVSVSCTINNFIDPPALASATLTVRHVNQAPFVATPVGPQTWTQGMSQLRIPLAGLFGDVDIAPLNDELSIRADPAFALPEGVVVDPLTKTCTVGADGKIPPAGTHEIRIMGTDKSGATSNSSFLLTVNSPAPSAAESGDSVSVIFQKYGSLVGIVSLVSLVTLITTIRWHVRRTAWKQSSKELEKTMEDLARLYALYKTSGAVISVSLTQLEKKLATLMQEIDRNNISKVLPLIAEFETLIVLFAAHYQEAPNIASIAGFVEAHVDVALDKLSKRATNPAFAKRLKEPAVESMLAAVARLTSSLLFFIKLMETAHGVRYSADKKSALIHTWQRARGIEVPWTEKLRNFCRSAKLRHNSLPMVLDCWYKYVYANLTLIRDDRKFKAILAKVLCRQSAGLTPKPLLRISDEVDEAMILCAFAMVGGSQALTQLIKKYDACNADTPRIVSYVIGFCLTRLRDFGPEDCRAGAKEALGRKSKLYAISARKPDRKGVVFVGLASESGSVVVKAGLFTRVLSPKGVVSRVVGEGPASPRSSSRHKRGVVVSAARRPSAGATAASADGSFMATNPLFSGAASTAGGAAAGVGFSLCATPARPSDPVVATSTSSVPSDSSDASEKRDLSDDSARIRRSSAARLFGPESAASAASSGSPTPVRRAGGSRVIHAPVGVDASGKPAVAASARALAAGRL